MTVAICGTNRFQISQHVRKLVEAFVSEHGDLALERFDANEAEYDQLAGAIESLPFLATKKMVVISDLSLNKQAAESLDQLIEKAGDTTDLLIVENKIDKRSAYYKQLKKQEQFHEYNDLDESQLANWLVGAAKEQGAMLNSSDARYLVQRVGLDQLRLQNELYKLAQYDKKITRQSIELLTEENSVTTIFNLIDSIFSGNSTRALEIYDEQRRQRVEPQAIHGLIVWQMHAIALASAAPRSIPAQQLAKDSGMSPFVLQKSQRIASKMDRTGILQALQLLRDIDYKSKRQILDYDEALRYFIVSLAN